jgi:hypothetical protein
MLTRRGMLRHVGAAGAAAATLRGGKRGTQRRDVRPAARRLRLPCARVRRPCGDSLPAGRAHTPPGAHIVAQAGGLALGRQFLPPALKKKLGKAFRFAPAVTSFAEQCGDLAEADIPEPVGLASQKGRLDHAYQTIQFVRGHLANADGYTAETRFYAGRVSRLQTYTRETVLCFSQPVSFVARNIRPDNIGLNPYKRTIFSVLARDRMLACARLA